ncbi:HIT family protein [Saccharospirillum impatiens]|uniref:HIT family protein n=1 Tax=Saccharospirillum impatiens TaxID=169438 RepID=UPI0003FB1A9E|nr:HIT family protein [Saccharospirillum impatiens]
MAYDPNNIFAKMLREEIPCIKIYEDEHTLAFMDIMPQTDGHALVIPKEQAVTLMDLSDEAAAHWIQSTKKVAAAIKAGLNASGVVLFQLNGEGAGQTVPHVHCHVIPGSIADLRRPHATTAADNEHLKALAEKIKAAF